MCCQVCEHCGESYCGTCEQEHEALCQPMHPRYCGCNWCWQRKTEAAEDHADKLHDEHKDERALRED